MNKKITPTKISELIPDQKNANKHSEYGMAILEKGIRKNGMGRSILISSDNEIIAGNGVTETAGTIGIENVRVVETDGNEIIAVKRTDIKSGTKEFYEMALSDNIIAKENIVMDAEVIDAICEEYNIDELSNEPSAGEGGKIKTENLEPFEMTHVLISFPPEKLIHIQSILEQVKNIEGVEYEQSSN